MVQSVHHATMHSVAFLLAAPVIGFAVNVIAQLVFARAMPAAGLLKVIVAAFAIGFLATGSLGVLWWYIHRASWLDGAALFATVIIIYGAASLVIFALINLGETSLRIKMLSMIIETPNGISMAELLQKIDEKELISVRLERLRTKRQARFTEGMYYPRISFLFLAASLVRALKLLIFGHAK